jgi:hypothetical protein
MSETKKIAKSEFKREWDGPNGKLFYHDVWLEGDDKPWSLGAKDKNPDFLKSGNTLIFEIKDASKRAIKRVQPKPGFGGGGGEFNQVGVTVGAALNQAVMLVAHGKVELKDVKSIAHRLAEVAFELKDEFAAK